MKEQFEMSTNVKIIDDTEKIMLMRECIDEFNPKYFTPNRSDRYFWADTFIRLSQKLKDERITKKEYLTYLETNPNMLPLYETLKAEIYEREQRGETRNKTRYDKLEKISLDMEKAKEVWELHELYSKKIMLHK